MFDCAICLEDNILEVNMHYMECLHYVCFNCFIQLKNESCPYCRQKINLFPGHNYAIDEDDYSSTEIDNDFIIPIIRRDRNEIKRKKYKRKRQELINIIQMENYLPIVPNIKHRYNRKIDNILI